MPEWALEYAKHQAWLQQNFPDVTSCFKVTLSKVDDKTYLQDSRNTCGRELKDVYVLVKFLDDKGRRIGVSHFEAHYIARGEHLYKNIPTELNVAYEKVQVRLITSDAAEGAK